MINSWPLSESVQFCANADFEMENSFEDSSFLVTISGTELRMIDFSRLPELLQLQIRL